MFYVDTSALLAVLDADDPNHALARKTWKELLESGRVPACNSYVLVETYALVQHRLGMAAARTFHEDIFPILHVDWIGDSLHRQAAEAVLAANRKALSLVDCASFATIRRLGIKTVFAFDKHFEEQGFLCLPPR